MGVSAAQGSAGLKQGVCTSTTRPSNPFEGQMIYETDTDLTLIWGGTAWQQVSGGTAVGNSGLVYITQANLTGSSVDIASCFSATYDSYLLQFSNTKTSSALITGWQLLNGATPITTATYNTQRASLQTAAWSLTNSSANTYGQAQITGNDVAQGASLYVYNPFLTTTTVSQGQGIYSGNAAMAFLELLVTTQTGTTSCDGIKLIATGGTFTTGKVIVYGLRQS